MAYLRLAFLVLATTLVAAADTSKQSARLPLEFEQNRGQVDSSVLFLARAQNGVAYLTRSGTVFQSGSSQIRMTLAGANPTATIKAETPLEGVSNYLIGNDRSKWIRGVEHWSRVRYAQVYPGIDLVYRGGQQALEYDFIVAAGADPSVIELKFDPTDQLSLEDGDLLISDKGHVMRQHRPVVYQERDGNRQFVEGRYRIRAAPGGDVVQFVLGAYDQRRPLVIDPVLTYGAVLVGTGSANGSGLAVDSSGNAYVGGYLQSLNFPTVNSLRSSGAATGLYRSRDAAGTWTNLSSPPQGAINALAADPKNPSLLYAATSVGVYKTADSGQTWSAVAGLPNGAWYAIAIDPSTSSILYAGGQGGFYKSTDAAVTWQRKLGLDVLSISIDASNPSTVWYVPSFGFLVKTTDGGQTFAGYFSQSANTTIAVDPNNSSKIYLGRLSLGLYLSTDGATFTQRINDFAPGGAPVTVNAVLIDPTNGRNVFFGTSAGLFRSTDGALTILPVSGAVTGLQILSLAFDPQDPTIVYAGTSGTGVFKSTDSGITWKSVGPVNQDVKALAVTSQAVFSATLANEDAYVSKIDPSGTKLIYSTYVGGNGDDALISLAADASGAVYGCGSTSSSDFAVRNAFQSKFGGGGDMFVFRLNSAGSDFLFSTYVGGYGNDACEAIALDSNGSIYLAGSTFTNTAQNNFPQGDGTGLRPGQDCVVVKLEPNASAISYAVLLGGSGIDHCTGVAVDANGNAYVTGDTYSPNFPIVPSTVKLAPAVVAGNAESALIAKFNPTGGLVYSQILGGKTPSIVGGSIATVAGGIAVNQAGQIFVTGYTYASDFPVTPNAAGASNPGAKIYVTAVQPNGSALFYSTFSPGLANEGAYGIALDADSNAWIAGSALPSNDGKSYFPTSPDAADARKRQSAGLLIGIDKTGSSMLYGSFTGGTGGSGGEAAWKVAVGPAGSVYVMGYSTNVDLAGSPTKFGSAAAPDYAIYVERFDPPIATGQPITTVVDGAAYTPNLAQGSVLIVKGTGLSADGYVPAPAPAYPLKLNNVSITLTPVGGGTPIKMLMVYTYNTGGVNQLAAVVPSTVPVGAYDLTVTNGAVTTTAFRTNVVARKPGIVTASSDGKGMAQATLQNSLILQRNTAQGKIGDFDTRPAHPGDRMDLWGTGLGADVASDAGGTSGDQTAAGTIRVILNGVQITPLYAGRSSGFPGLDQIVFTIPTNVTLSCSVSLQVQAGSALSNAVTIATGTGNTCGQ